MSETRRGFLGMLGLATAATGLSAVTSAGQSAEELTVRKRRIGRAITYTAETPLPAGAEVFMHRAVVNLKPDRSGAIRQQVSVFCGLKLEGSHTEDRVGIAFTSIVGGQRIKRLPHKDRGYDLLPMND